MNWSGGSHKIFFSLSFIIISKSLFISIPKKFLFKLEEANAVVPLPINGSNTISPSSVKSLINHSGKVTGKTALWFLFPHSVGICKTLVGNTKSLSTQFSIFLPNPLLVFELYRVLSFSDKFFNHDLDQSPIGIFTLS